MLKTLSVDYTVDGHPGKAAALDGETICLGDVIDPEPTVRVQTTADGNVLLEAWQTDNTNSRRPPAKRCVARWTAFPPRGRSRARGKCVSRPRPGTGEHHPGQVDLVEPSRRLGRQVLLRNGDLPEDFPTAARALAAGRAVYLDLGQVAVIAQVSVNGKDLGILWNAPFRVEATKALRAGEISWKCG